MLLLRTWMKRLAAPATGALCKVNKAHQAHAGAGPQGPVLGRVALVRRVSVLALILGGLWAVVATPVLAQAGAKSQPAASSAPPTASVQASLPPAVLAALKRAEVPPQAVSALVVPVHSSQPRLAWRAQQPANPASVMKLITSFAALELLGPAYTWETTVYLGAQLEAGVLAGDLYIQGGGDPKLVAERLWLLLRRLREQGVRDIAGDIVLDRSAFVSEAHDAGTFDDEPWRPYNVAADALLVNFHALSMEFAPDPALGRAWVRYEPPLAQVDLPRSVPLAPADTACGDWRSQLQAEFADPDRIQFAGSYPPACGVRNWFVAQADPRGFAARAVLGMWRELGGTLRGQVREGTVPSGLQPALRLPSATLAEVVRDVNKYSNNVMAQQVFLSLGLPAKNEATGGVRNAGRAGNSGSSLEADAAAAPGSSARARAVLHQWWRERVGAEMPLVLDNGSGLSRDTRVTAEGLARMLLQAWDAPVMPELLASLPVAGVDGTLRRATLRQPGRAHLKTGTLRDSIALAGYVHGAHGQRFVLVAMINHPQAPQARAALHALVDWVGQQK